MLVKDSLVGRGWAVLDKSYKFSTRFNLKWVQTRGEIDFSQHIPGKQLVNHLPNIT